MPHARSRCRDDRAPAERERAFFARGERIAGEEARRGGEIGVVERRAGRPRARDLLEFARRRGDRVARRRAKAITCRDAEARRVITAFVLLKVEPGGVKSLAEELLAIAGVAEVY